jgi:hypothetical protein
VSARPLTRVTLGLALVLLLPGFALSQGLGDAAARERQKREAAPTKEKARVLTNDDLSKQEAGQPASESAPPASSSSESRSADRENESGESREQEDPRQAELRQAQEQVDQARDAVVAAEQRVNELSAKLNPMSPTFIYNNPQNADAANEEIRTRQALTAAQGELQQARDALVRANQAQERVQRGQPARAPEDR